MLQRYSKMARKELLGRFYQLCELDDESNIHEVRSFFLLATDGMIDARLLLDHSGKPLTKRHMCKVARVLVERKRSPLKMVSDPSKAVMALMKEENRMDEEAQGQNTRHTRGYNELDEDAEEDIASFRASLLAKGDLKGIHVFRWDGSSRTTIREVRRKRDQYHAVDTPQWVKRVYMIAGIVILAAVAATAGLHLANRTDWGKTHRQKDSWLGKALNWETDRFWNLQRLADQSKYQSTTDPSSKDQSKTGQSTGRVQPTAGQSTSDPAGQAPTGQPTAGQSTSDPAGQAPTGQPTVGIQPPTGQPPTGQPTTDPTSRDTSISARAEDIRRDLEVMTRDIEDITKILEELEDIVKFFVN